MATILRIGSSETRLCTVSIFEKMGETDHHCNLLIQDHGIDFFKSLLEVLTDEISEKASSCALKVLIKILKVSKKSRLKAIEAGAICTLIELVPDSTRSKCEKIMYLIKLMCESADGRLAFAEQAVGIAAVSEKLLNVSDAATKIGVKFLWLLCNFNPTQKERVVVNILKLHANSWSRYPCFPREMKEYLGLGGVPCA
ncbi:hypothetical protein LIER_27291 [Lithospermum erythrorhizon]|uniref:U-box domain-containing protein n=1 Tax=Lithospermum erythrorhizon TaxID=34254 RepID=A0AAV3RF33_LITER